jgi:hypothetical protein
MPAWTARAALAAAALLPAAALAQHTGTGTGVPRIENPGLPLPGQPIDSAYSARIRELTPTDPRWSFSTELVSYLPASTTVPSPLKVLGYVPGTVGKLSKVAEVTRYFRALDAASPRVQVFSIGTSDDGREMILAAIADEEVMGRLEEYKGMTARLADPRRLDPAERARLVRDAKPIYWLTGSIHSPETGSPEMLMELAYRLAVDESEHVRAIRRNVITLITPVVEVDGRDRQVDAYHLSKSLKLGSYGVPLIYWGKYTAHDNNRDGMVLSQRLTQNINRAFFEWHPLVMHDLHESVPFLYTSTGTGPYNEEFDPIVISEWHTLAYQEINELTRRGLPGVWTHGFYDGWTPNYMFTVANFHNAIGRFYETYTSMGADCHTVKLPDRQTTREWDRPNPPVNGIRWCIRSNINYQQSGVLVALRYVADHPQTFLENFVAKGERTVRRGQAGPPYAFVIPRGQRRAAESADLVNLFRAHQAEVHEAAADFTVKGTTAAVVTGPGANPSVRSAPLPSDTATVEVKSGDWIVRLDQPYAQMPRTLLSVQRFKPDDPAPYDDTGWTMDELRHVVALKVTDSSVLTKPMRLLAADAAVQGTVAGSGRTLVVPHLGDWRSAVLPWKAAGARVAVADTAFEAGGKSFPAGTFLLRDATDGTRTAVRALGLAATAVSAATPAREHPVTLPRIALMHSWLETQNEGWVRFAFDQMAIPYTYIADQDLRDPRALDRFDVVFFEHVSDRGGSLLHGRPLTGPPIPWKKTAQTPSHGGYDETDDVRPGMGLEGAATLKRFVERGGLLITTGGSSKLPVDLGFNPTVSVAEARGLKARGTIVRAQAGKVASPILYGYERTTFPVYFNQSPVLSVQTDEQGATSRNEGVDSTILAERERMRARVVLRFHERADSLLVSGQLDGGGELAGKGAVVDAPVGKGHLLLFAIRPIWRHGSQGTFALALNAIANWNRLDAAAPAVTRPAAVAANRGR